MNRSLKKRYVNIGFVLALLILTGVNVMIYFNMSLHFEDEQVINRSLTIIQASEVLFSNIIEAETNRRGYLITSNTEFLKSYYPSLNSIDSSLTVLNSLITDPNERVQMDSLQRLIFNRKGLLGESIELRGKSGDRTTQIVLTEQSKYSVDKIKQSIEKIQNEETKILNNRLLEAKKSSSSTLTNLVTGNILAFTLMIIAVILLNRSINRRRETEYVLNENRKWLATTLESIGDAVIVSSKVGEIMFMNKVAEKLTGWTSSDASGLLLDHIFNIYNEDTGEKADDPIVKVLQSGETANLNDHTVLRTKNGNEIPIDDSAAPIKNDNGEIIGVVLVFRNISERRRNEKELLSSKKFIQRIADSLPSILYIYDLTGPKITYTNYKIENLLGFNSEEVMDLGPAFFEKYIHPEDFQKLRSAYQEYSAAKDTDILNNEYRIKNAEGQWRWFRSYDVVFSRNSENRVTEILGSAFDITDRKLLEEELKNYSGHLEEIVNNRTGELQKTNLKLKNEIRERAKAERNIIDAEEKFRSLVENALIGIYILQDGRYMYVNPKYEEIFGYSRGEMSSIDIWSVVSESDKVRVENNIRKRMDNEVASIQYTYKAVKKDGTLIDVEVRGSTMFYNGSKAIIGTLQDITERLRFEEELRNSRQKLLIHVERTPLAVIEWDLDFCVNAWNASAERIFGYSKKEMQGKWAHILVEDHAHEQVRNIWHNLINKSGGERSTNRNVTKDGKIILCEWYNTPLIDETGRVIGAASLVEDITERIKAENELNEQKEFLRAVIDTDPNFVFAKDWDGRFTLVNKAAAKNYGTTVEDLIGKTDGDFNPNAEEVEHFLKDDREVISTGVTKFIAEERVTDSKTGKVKWYQTIKVPLKSTEGEYQVLGVAADITARKLAEEITKKSLKEKELLLKEIHHRVKNNLQIIISLLKLQSKFVFDKRDLDIFNKSRSRVETMSLIHEKLYRSVDISQIDIGNYLKDLVSHLLKAYNVNSNVIDFEINAEDILLTIDTSIPCGLIVNEIINNILKHAFPPGYKGKISLNVAKCAEKIILTISDNGIGIPESFEPEKSDSLGVQLIETLVRQLEGKISIDKTNGTAFKIEFEEIRYKERI
jgi:PAS domain S-box-containing protein